VIEFPCTCGHRFSLDDDEAGGLVQCPQCNRLNDVPTLSEQGQIAHDGTYKMEAAELRDPRAAEADLAYVYQKGVYDVEGNEIDLRNTPEETASIGLGEPIPLAPSGRPRRGAPRYDPETGELIAPLEVKTDGHATFESSDPAAIPMARALVNYATGAAAMKPGYLRIFIRLLAPLNLAVMIGVFAIHLLLMPLLGVVLAGILFVIVGLPFLVGAILAHYGNVIEDTGPYDRDELPRPLRDLGWYEDLWSPFCNVAGSLILCYGPMVVVPELLGLMPAARPFAWFASIACCGMGTFFFPAALLTLQTSGTALNLRPDRLLAVIAGCGRDYFMALVIWVIAGGLYALGWGGTSLWIANLIHPVPLPMWMMSFAIGVTALAAGIFMIHYFCMVEGMLYRIHYPKFPWILQRHVPAPKSAQPVGLPPSRRPPAVRASQDRRSH
jgi:hypothetical protein